MFGGPPGSDAGLLLEAGVGVGVLTACEVTLVVTLLHHLLVVLGVLMLLLLGGASGIFGRGQVRATYSLSMRIRKVASHALLARRSFEASPASLVLVMTGVLGVVGTLASAMQVVRILILIGLKISGSHDSTGSFPHLVLLLAEQWRPVVHVVLLVAHGVEEVFEHAT